MKILKSGVILSNLTANFPPALTSSNGNSDKIAPSFSANESCVNLTFLI